MKKMTQTPKIRFPEFINTEEWREKSLGSCLDYIQPTPYLVDSTDYHIDYKTPVLTAGKTFILGYTNEKNGIFNNLPVIIFDDFTTSTQYVDFPFKVKSSAIKILLAREDANLKFMFETIQYITFKPGTHERHWISQFASMSVFVPTEKEQQKIANCLSSIDELISAQNLKVKALNKLKKGLLQYIFPSDSGTLPRLRLLDEKKLRQYEANWTLKEFGEICKFVRGPFGGSLTKDSFVKKGYAVYEQSHAIYENFDTFRYFINEEKFIKLKRFAVEENDILMSCSGTMGKFAIIPKQPTKGVINQALLKLTVNKDYDTNFIKYSLELQENIEKLLSQSAGGAIKNVVGVSEMKKMKISIPERKEQQKIANFLISIDELITAQKLKLEKLTKHKLGLLQHLFPLEKKVEA